MEKGSKRSSAKCTGALPKPSASLSAKSLARLDVTLPVLRIEGVLHRRVVSGYGEYMTVAGPVKVLRHRYRAAGTNGQSECPLELRAGIVEGFFTPLAARMGLWVVTHLTPAEGEQLFGELGGMHLTQQPGPTAQGD